VAFLSNKYVVVDDAAVVVVVNMEQFDYLMAGVLKYNVNVVSESVLHQCYIKRRKADSNNITIIIFNM
jgi:hypothetical protein